MVVGRLKRLSLCQKAPFWGTCSFSQGLVFFMEVVFSSQVSCFVFVICCIPKNEAFMEKPTNVWDICLVKFCTCPKWIRNSSKSKLLVEGRSFWSRWFLRAPRVEALKLISDLGDLTSWNNFDPLRQVPTVAGNQKSGINSPVEVGSLSCYLQGFSTIPGGWGWDFWTIIEYRTGDTHQQSSLLSLFLYFEVISKWCSEVFAHFEIHIIYIYILYIHIDCQYIYQYMIRYTDIWLNAHTHTHVQKALKVCYCTATCKNSICQFGKHTRLLLLPIFPHLKSYRPEVFRPMAWQ